MNIDGIKNAVTTVAMRSGLKLKKYAPEILTGAGIVGGVTAAVLAAKATLELETSLERSKGLIAAHKELRANSTEESYPTKTFQKDMAISYYRGVQAVTKLYAVPVGLGVASVVCILGAHGLMRKRNASLVVAYNALDSAFRAYRKRVVEEFGEDKDWDIRHGISHTIVESEDPETGKMQKKKKAVQDPNSYSGYARFFDELNPNWQPQAELNLFFLKCQQTMANEKLRAYGHLMLNEVYDMLGIPRTSAGCVVGWVIGESGDNFVDFGIFDIEKPKARDFVNGFEQAILLDFNVDGVVYDKI